MTRPSRIVFGGAIAAALFIMTLPTASEAAWWPWSKRSESAAPAPDAPEGDLSVAQADTPDRLARAEQKIRQLTGQLEELTFQLRQTQDQVQRLQEQLAGGGRPPAVASELAPDADGGVLVIAKPPSDPASTDAEAPALPGGEEPLGRLVIDAPGTATDEPIDLTAGARIVDGATAAVPAAEPPATEVALLGDPRADYERAYNSILSGDYEMAEATFRQFVSTYPGDERAPDAQYWLGESFFARGQFRESADEFLAAYKAYPKSGKAADTLLKLGLSLAGLGERDAACSTYAEVLKKYPQASKALRQRVANEQAVAAC